MMTPMVQPAVQPPPPAAAAAAAASTEEEDKVDEEDDDTQQQQQQQQKQQGKKNAPPPPHPPGTTAARKSASSSKTPTSPAKASSSAAAAPAAAATAFSQLYNFLLAFKVDKGVDFTHTSFGRPTGAFYIPYNVSDEFHRLYVAAVSAGGAGGGVHLTERHRDPGPVVMDLDFRYDAPPSAATVAAAHDEKLATQTTLPPSPSAAAAAAAYPQLKRRHTARHVEAIVRALSAAVARYVIPPSTRGFDVFVLEKPGPVMSKSIVKDGLHLMVPEVVTRPAVQYMMREALLRDPEFRATLADLRITNRPEDCLDEAVIERNNWMMYGSCKPGAEPYAITSVHRCYFPPTTATTAPATGEGVENDNGNADAAAAAEATTTTTTDAPSPSPSAERGGGGGGGSEEGEREDEGLLRRRVITSTYGRERCAEMLLGNEDDNDVANDKEARLGALVARLSIRNKYVATPLRVDRQLEVQAYQAGMDEKARRRRACQNALDRSVASAGGAQHQARLLQQPGGIGRANTSEHYDTARRLVGLLDTARTDSYSHWMQVGWCLRNIDHRLLDAWEEFSRRSSKYMEGECPRLWVRMRIGNLGIGTLHMWAKQDNPAAYRELMRNDLFDVIHRSASGTHHDVARVVHHMYRYEYACSSITNKRWFRFAHHRWAQVDSAYTLRNAMSTTVFSEYMKVVTYHTNAMASAAAAQAAASAGGGGGGGEDEGTGGGGAFGGAPSSSSSAAAAGADGKHADMSRALFNVAMRLKDARFKDNVMRECTELFFHDRFEDKLDSNPYLVGFPNGVYDLEAMEFREGRPDDYVSFSATVDYVPHDPDCEQVREMTNFFEQVMPNRNVRDYMLTTLAACLCGVRREERFYVWTGCGSNGKSKIVELYEKAFEGYCCKFPVTLLTQKRAASNAANSEITRAKGKRFAVLQEPSDGERINIGIMKELSGGDKIMARPMYGVPIEFKPQFQLFLLCNDVPSAPSEDFGTWRRIRRVDFEMRFVPHPTQPNEREMDVDLPRRFEAWAPHLIPLLIERYYRPYSMGSLVEPAEVLRSTHEYQKENDHYADFVDTCVERGEADDFVLVDDLFREFRDWVRSDNIPAGVPKKKVFCNQMGRMLGKLQYPGRPNAGYRGFRVRDRSAGRVDLMVGREEDDNDSDGNGNPTNPEGGAS